MTWSETNAGDANKPQVHGCEYSLVLVLSILLNSDDQIFWLLVLDREFSEVLLCFFFFRSCSVKSPGQNAVWKHGVNSVPADSGDRLRPTGTGSVSTHGSEAPLSAVRYG